MPIYEFVCGQCGRKFRMLVGVVANSSPLQCPRCQSDNLNRQMSRFARVRNEDDALDDLADDMEALGDSDNPKTMRRLVKEMSAGMDDEGLEEDFEAMMDEEASGVSGTNADAGGEDL